MTSKCKPLPRDKPANLQKIVFKEAAADESQSAEYGFDNLANDKPRPKGWSIDSSDDKSVTTRRGVLIPDKPFGFAGGTVLTLRLKHDMAFSKCGIGRFRISVTTMADPHIAVRVPARLRKRAGSSPGSSARKNKPLTLPPRIGRLPRCYSRFATTKQNSKNRTPTWESPRPW